MAKLGLRDHKYDEFSAATAMDLLKMEVEMSSSSPNKTRSLLWKSPSMEVKKSTTFLNKKTRRGLIIVSITMGILVFLSWYYITQHGRMSIRQAGPIHFNPTGRKLYVKNEEGDFVFQGDIGMLLPDDVYPMTCEKTLQGDAICINWLKSSEENELLADMEITSAKDGAINTIQIKWLSKRLDAPLQDCILLSTVPWYYGSPTNPVLWPMQDMEIPMQPFISGETNQGEQSFGSLLERYWLSSKGFTVKVDEDIPLYISANENNSQKLCLKSEILNSPFQNPLNEYPTLIYTVFISNNLTYAHQEAIKAIFRPPLNTPNENLFKKPIWQMHQPNISNYEHLEFVNSIKEHGFKGGDIEVPTSSLLSDLWSLNNLSDDLKDSASDFTWTWKVSPYFEVTSHFFHKMMSQGFLIQDEAGLVPALTKWKDMVVGLLDTTNEDAADWFIDQLMILRNSKSVNSFVFEGGYGKDMPIHFASDSPFNDPNLICKHYTKMADRLGNAGRRKCGHQSQESHLFIQMDPGSPLWHNENGLRGIIPSVILYGLLGYPFVVPPPVCGPVGSNNNVQHPILTRELYIRWTQLLTYLPVMSFCVMPWEFDEEVVNFTRNMVEKHEMEIAPMMKRWALTALTNGEPIIRPIWWNSPRNESALKMDSEFLIGDELLVAPIVDIGATARDIYLPAGTWADILRHKDVHGEQWLRRYEVGLWETPTFRKITLHG